MSLLWKRGDLWTPNPAAWNQTRHLQFLLHFPHIAYQIDILSQSCAKYPNQTQSKTSQICKFYLPLIFREMSEPWGWLPVAEYEGLALRLGGSHRHCRGRSGHLQARICPVKGPFQYWLHFPCRNHQNAPLLCQGHFEQRQRLILSNQAFLDRRWRTHQKTWAVRQYASRVLRRAQRIGVGSLCTYMFAQPIQS